METLPLLDIYAHVISFSPASPSFVDHVYAVLEDHRNVILEVDLKGIGFQIIIYVSASNDIGHKTDQFNLYSRLGPFSANYGFPLSTIRTRIP